MKKLIFNIAKLFTLAVLISSCARPIPVKPFPEYKGVDPRVQPIVKEYMWLSSVYHISFDQKVTIGFKKINEGNVVGLTTYGSYFREIDIDSIYWQYASPTSKLTLLYHELTHAYCNRRHDYAAGKEYPETEAGRIAQALEWRAKGGPRPGFWDDGCPTSLMYPVVLDDDCMQYHYMEYVQEMFDRCDPF